MSLLEKAIFSDQRIGLNDILIELGEMCERTHSSCDSECLVYSYNGEKVPIDEKTANCSCFKRPALMYAFIRDCGVSKGLNSVTYEADLTERSAQAMYRVTKNSCHYHVGNGNMFCAHPDQSSDLKCGTLQTSLQILFKVVNFKA